MADTILLNNEAYNINDSDLPCLIHYAPKTGGSHFSISLIADLFLRGENILFLTAYPMAKDNFLEQIKGEEAKTSFITEEGQLNTNAQAIILESGNEELFLKAVKKLSDLKDRVILIKNMEVFSKEVIDSCLNLQKVILSGDLDKCLAKEQISTKQYQTIVLFSKSQTPLKVEPPILEKYTGYLWSENKKGLVSIEKDNL